MANINAEDALIIGLISVCLALVGIARWLVHFHESNEKAAFNLLNLCIYLKDKLVFEIPEADANGERSYAICPRVVQRLDLNQHLDEAFVGEVVVFRSHYRNFKLLACTLLFFLVPTALMTAALLSSPVGLIIWQLMETEPAVVNLAKLVGLCIVAGSLISVMIVGAAVYVKTVRARMRLQVLAATQGVASIDHTGRIIKIEYRL